MKKYLKLTLTALVCAAAIAGCSKEQNNSAVEPDEERPEGEIPGDNNPQDTDLDFTVIANASDPEDQTPESKTAIDGNFVSNWVKGDNINVYHAAQGSSIESDGQFTLNGENKFKGKLSSALTSGQTYQWYAFYPYAEGNSNPSAISITIPESTAVKGADPLHLCGANAPLYGKAGFTAPETPEIQMHQIISVVEVVVNNNQLTTLDVSKIQFTAPEAITGTFTADITGDQAVLSGSGKSNTAEITLAEPLTIKASESAKFYIGMKPFTAASGSDLTIAVGDIVKTVKLSSEKVFAAGKIKTVEFNVNGPGFSVNAEGKQVVFSRGNLWYGNQATNYKFKLEDAQNGSYPAETASDGVALNGTHISHFLWSTKASEGCAAKRTTTSFKTTDRLFAADGGVFAGWTVLSKDEWEYLFNKREVNGGKGDGYSYFNCCKAKNYYIDGSLVRGLLIFPDNYSDDRLNKGNNKDSKITWEEINEAGIAYLPANGLSNRRYDTGWISGTKFNGYYLCSDVFGTDTAKAPYGAILFKDSQNPYSFNPSATTSAYGIRLVKEIK